MTINILCYVLCQFLELSMMKCTIMPGLSCYFAKMLSADRKSSELFTKIRQIYSTAYCAGVVLGEPVVDRQAGVADGADGEGLLLYRQVDNIHYRVLDPDSLESMQIATVADPEGGDCP